MDAHIRAFILLLVVFAGPAGAADVVPAEYQGRWVPATAACDSPTHILVTGSQLTLVNGKDSQALGGIEMAGPGYFAPDYTGILAVLITEFDGNQPAFVTFNAGEKRGAGLVEFSPVQPGVATGALAAYNAHISKLNLAKRFPLDKVPLKQCAPQ